MNRVFWVLILSAVATALFGDLLGAPLRVAPEAVVHAASGATIRRVSTDGFPKGTAFNVSAQGTVVHVDAQGLKAQEDIAPQLALWTSKAASPSDKVVLDLGFLFVKDGAPKGSLRLLVDVAHPERARPEALAAGLAQLKQHAPGRGVAPRLESLTSNMFSMAEVAAELALGLIGILALWMGVLRVAEAAGLVELLARLLRPLLSRLFPDVPPDHPAMGAMVMNIAANMLGLGNAATPLGLEAMRRLQELNPLKNTASNAMVLFLAINTSGLTLIPARTMALRAQNGSASPTSILLPTLLATAVSTVVAVVMAKFLSRRFAYEEPAGDADVDDETPADPAAKEST